MKMYKNHYTHKAFFTNPKVTTKKNPETELTLYTIAIAQIYGQE